MRLSVAPVLTDPLQPTSLPGQVAEAEAYGSKYNGDVTFKAKGTLNFSSGGVFNPEGSTWVFTSTDWVDGGKPGTTPFESAVLPVTGATVKDGVTCPSSIDDIATISSTYEGCTPGPKKYGYSGRPEMHAWHYWGGTMSIMPQWFNATINLFTSFDIKATQTHTHTATNWAKIIYNVTGTSVSKLEPVPTVVP